jgi:hypothetical protein
VFSWAEWDAELLGLELLELKDLDFDLALTGFDSREIDDFLAGPLVWLSGSVGDDHRPAPWN